MLKRRPTNTTKNTKAKLVTIAGPVGKSIKNDALIPITIPVKETEDEINNGHPFKTVMKHHTGGKMFPFCYINGEYVGGYQQVHQNLMTGKLKEQLNEINIDFEEDF